MVLSKFPVLVFSNNVSFQKFQSISQVQFVIASIFTAQSQFRRQGSVNYVAWWFLLSLTLCAIGNIIYFFNGTCHPINDK